MKKNMSVLLSLISILFALSATAEGNFIPVPTVEEAPLRLFGGIDSNVGFDSFRLNHLQGAGSVVYGVGSGLDVGFALHGGVINNSGLFMTGNAAKGLVGADVMLRFLGNITDMFFMGLQATVGYSNDMTFADLKLASSIPTAVGLAMGLSLADVVQLYVFPQFNFGGKTAAEQKPDDIKNAVVWGSQIGMSAAIGAWVNMGGTNLVIEARPEWASVQDLGNFKSDNFSTNVLVGLAWDL